MYIIGSKYNNISKIYLYVTKQKNKYNHKFLTEFHKNLNSFEIEHQKSNKWLIKTKKKTNKKPQIKF